MDLPDRAARLEARAERTAAARRERHTPARSPRSRRLAAVALVAVLAIAWYLVEHADRASTAAVAPTAVAPPSTIAGPVDPAPLRALFAGESSCADHGVEIPEVTCTVDGVRVAARLVGTAEAERAFAPAAGPRTGPPACATGMPDERTWSRPAAPGVAVGRYRCLIEAGHAAMWWTDDAGIIAHAVASDDDLARLFDWWRAQHG